MTSTDNQLFTVEEALIRLGQNREQGCLSASNSQEVIQIYVQDGLILTATSETRKGREAAERALHLIDSSYQWTRGVKAPNQELNLGIQEFVLRHGNLHKTKIAETGKIASGVAKTENESKYKYFLVPDDQPTVKLFLTKAATVLGRDKSSDLIIDNKDVSRRHCLLDIQPRGLFVLDLDSTNGTYVNGILITDGFLNHGDRLELGAYQLTLNREAVKGA